MIQRTHKNGALWPHPPSDFTELFRRRVNFIRQVRVSSRCPMKIATVLEEKTIYIDALVSLNSAHHAIVIAKRDKSSRDAKSEYQAWIVPVVLRRFLLPRSSAPSSSSL